MSTAQYEIYQRKVFELAYTLVVKSGATADAINAHLQMLGQYVNDQDPRSWKYYLNLNGQYHTTDVPMTVRSIDTLQTIPFTRSSLQLHRATAREYAYGSEYYNALVARYPEQELLIRCILNPIDIDRAIAAKDGEILYYDPALVEENETNLIPKLNDWSLAYHRRWNVAAYAVADSLYDAAFLGIFFHQIPAAVMNIRLHNCHTIYAHSFHILEFLAGQGRLDRYANALTRKQLLWLYRNIRWINRNVGKTETLGILTEHLLTERGFPLAEWTMRHNTADMLEEVYPDIEFARRSLNGRTVTNGADTITVAGLLEKEIPVARSNGQNLVQAESDATRAFESSLSSGLRTKVLESSILDTTDAYPYTLTDTLLNHWLYLAYTGQYTSTVTVDNPRTGGRLSINVKDAFILSVYLTARSRGFELPHLPYVTARMIRKEITPTLAELTALVPAAQPESLAQTILANAPALQSSYISTEAFYRSITDIYEALWGHWALWMGQHDYRHNGWTEIQAKHLYSDHFIDLGETVSYLEWFADRGMDFREYSDLECELLSNALIAAATGTDLKITLSLKTLQESMLKIMAQLSSYSVQFIQTINSDPIKVVGWKQISPTELESEGDAESFANIVRVRPLSLKSHGSEGEFIDVSDLGASMSLATEVFLESRLDTGLDYRMEGAPTIHYQLHLPRIDVMNRLVEISQVEQITQTQTDDYIPPNQEPLSAAFSVQQSDQYTITDADRATLQQRWAMRPAITVLDPESILPVPYLDGLDYPPMTLLPTLDGLTYPDQTVLDDVTLTVLELPPAPSTPWDTITLAPTLDGFDYPTP